MTPVICFALVIALYWVIDHDAAGIMSGLPADAYLYARLAAGTAA